MLLSGVSEAWGQPSVTLTTAQDVSDGTEVLYWIESFGATGFYMIPMGTNDNSGVSTSNMPNEKMLWYFMDATENSVQYYYIVNKSTGKYLCHTGNLGDNNNIKIANKTEANDASCKFTISGSSGQWLISPQESNSYYVNKKGSNVNYSNGLKSSTAADANSKWNFVAKNSVTWAHPFTNSTNSEKHYYHIHNATANGAPYYMSTDDDSDPYATISNVDNSKRIWYFIEATSDNTIPNLKYYYIVNAVTGKYLKFTGTANGNVQANSLQLFEHTGSETGNTEDRFQFMVLNAKGDTYSAYSIMPKLEISYYNSKHTSLSPIGDNNKNDYSGTNAITLSNDMKIGVYNDRGQNYNYAHWLFEVTDYVAVEAPTITNNYDGTISLSTTTPGATIYYTTNGDTPDNTSTPYSSAFSLGDATVIKAIAYLGSEHSDVTTYNVPQYDAPTISFNSSTSQVTITSEGTVYYTTDGGTPTTSSSAYSAPFTVSSGVTIKAIATHPGYVTSTMAELSISQVATPTIQDNGSNAISITCATAGATIYYTTDGTTPSISSTEYTGPLTENVSGVTIKAIAVKENMIPSEVGSGTVTLQCASPAIARSGNNGFTITCAFPSTGVTIYYTTDGSNPTTSSSTTTSGGAVTAELPVTVKAMAVATGYSNSAIATVIVTQGVDGDGSAANPYIIESQSDVGEFVTKANTSEGASKHYKVIATSPLDFSGVSAIIQPFSGTFDGGLQTISGLSHALFNSVDGGTIKNVILDNVTVSGGTNAGAICNETTGSTRIYNCGVLASTSSTISGSGHVGSIVGSISGNTRVINCYSFANVNGGTYTAGIVGYNAVATTQNNITTSGMVMNCMFYGDITGSNISPVYGGALIDNAGETGINNYNYYRRNRYDRETDTYVDDVTFDNNMALADYHRSWPADAKYLTRFEYYRSILNSNKKLCTWWVNGSDGIAPTDEDIEDVGIAKWVLDPSIAPYPILKKWGKYPSVINQNPDKRFDPSAKTWVNRVNVSDHWGEDMAPDTEGQTLGSVTVTINAGDYHSGSESRTIPVTAMDTDNNDYCYGKIQLPYYNEIFGNPDGDTWEAKYGGNYTAHVVTGWDVSGGSAATDDNFADRDSYSGRVYAQGGYFYVPKDVTSITITAHWGDAVYLCNKDYSIDRVNVAAGGKETNGSAAAKTAKYGSPFTPAGTIPTTFQGQTVYTTIQDAINNGLSNAGSGKDVYNQAIVLIGNVQVRNHSYVVNLTGNNAKPFTLMSADLDFDNEPDNCLQLQFRNDIDRPGIQPIRFDFLPVPELGLAIRTNKLAYAIGIMIPLGHFEITETAFMHTTQFEYDGDVSRNGKSPVIINGGEHEMFTKRKQRSDATQRDRTSYFMLGGNAWVHRFAPGAHPNTGDKPDIYLFPVNIIGGQVKELYLTGLYRPELPTGGSVIGGAPHCYIDGGKFDIIAGAGYDKVNSGEDVIFKIDHSLIGEFYGGGINASNPVSGNINVTINNSQVDKYCGGPKVGAMTDGKTVTTHATGTTFGVFYGGGNGGNSYYRQLQRDGDMASIHIGTWDDQSYNWNGFTPLGKKDDGADNKGYHAEYEFEVFNQSNGLTDEITQRGFIKWIQFGITTTGDVSNTLENCKVLGNFYGGGNLATVAGDVTSTLTNTKVNGNVFGAGFSAAIPTFQVHNKDGKTFPSINDAGVITEGHIPYASTVYEWTNNLDGVSGHDAAYMKAHPTYQKNGKWYCYTWNSLANLGTVTGKATLNINGEETVVNKSVYGGGEESAVGGDTEVNVSGGTIGYANAPAYGAVVGNVYGGGMGKESDKMAGLVKGNTNVNISGTAESPFIYHNVYGGGAHGSVGDFTYDANGMPTALNTANTGVCNVTITGGKIGTTGKDNGMVYGSSRGDVATPVNGLDPNDLLAWVYDTKVTIGTSGGDFSKPLIKGSVYGSGENGHTLHDAEVKVHSGTIGIESGEEITYNGIKYVGPRYLYRGNVYGGGCGTDTYEATVEENGQTKKKTYYNFNAGIVKGNANVIIDGGYIVHNVYGGGAMGSVGTFNAFADAAYVAAKEADHKSAALGMPIGCVEGTGKCTVAISGGKIGVPGVRMEAGGGPDDYGHVFGAGRGDVKDPNEYPNVETCAYFDKTEVTISGSALVIGGVYGGSESGHVVHNTLVKIQGGQIGCGEGLTEAYSEEDWTAESPTTLKPTNHWTYVDDGAPYDQYADENGDYANNVSSEGGNRKATDGHSFYGNVFAGGSGYYPYAQGKWLYSAGRVAGNAEVQITGGHILNNVYGGCEMSDVWGDAIITMSGGTVGVPRSKQEILYNPTIGHVFGAGMGDKRIFFNQVTNVENTNVTVTGGRVYGSVHGGGEDGHVLDKATTNIRGGEIGTIKDGTTSGWDGNVFGGGQGSPTALTAGTVGGNVELNIEGGTMHGSVYGGGRIASVGTFFEAMMIPDPSDPTKEIENPLYGKMQDGDDHGNITVNLKGGTINQNVYGGCMGTRGQARVDQVRFAISKNVTVKLNEDVADNARGCAVKGNIFGCNNVNSSPQGQVEVHVYKTQNALASQIAGTVSGENAVQPKVKGRYDVKAVYGGGNMAAYLPKGPNATGDDYDGQNTTFSTKVIIDGCDRTSIQQVYGGGNAASTPATEVTVNGTYEIDELFGGGNGKDKISYNEGATMLDNPGANVGFYDYSAEEDIYNTKEKRTTDPGLAPTFISNYVYGLGTAAVNIYGGLLHRVFGGSNTKGNVRKTAITLLEEKMDGESAPLCPFQVEDVYGGGKSAPMDADAQLLMECIPGLRAAYGGAEAADIQGGVTLTITNGRFDRVFGGNNISGTIRGPIVVNIEETGCKPIIIGELYGGGNLAGYSVYDYNSDGSLIQSGTTPLYNSPVVNVTSFTSIGSVFGGGYGSTATMVGSPTVNINVVEGAHKTTVIGENAKTYNDENGFPIPSHASGKIGAINNVFGGGNAARVVGNTQVNIGTEEGTGADIRGNVYGGGNNAEVTGNTNVQIGK